MRSLETAITTAVRANAKWDDDKPGKCLTEPQDCIPEPKILFNIVAPQDRADVISHLHWAAEAP